MIRHIRRGRQGTRLAPKYKGRYGEPKEDNIGVSQGSAISALLFIIYLGGVVGDLASLNRRPHLQTRIIQGRPHVRNKKAYGGDKTRRKCDERQETRTIKNATTNTPQQDRRNMSRSQKQRQGKRTEAYRRRTAEGQKEAYGNKERNTELETGNAITTLRKRHIRDDKWQKVDSRTKSQGAP